MLFVYNSKAPQGDYITRFLLFALTTTLRRLTKQNWISRSKCLKKKIQNEIFENARNLTATAYFHP